MKRLLACFMVALSGIASSSTVELPEPTLPQLNPGITCAYPGETTNDTQTTYTRQAITGFSADGTQVYAKTYGSWPCGTRGRGGLKYYPWCGTFTWTLTFDASGNLNQVETATFASTPGQCADYQDWNSGATFYNPYNYGATVESEPIIYGYYKGVATLLTP